MAEILKRADALVWGPGMLAFLLGSGLFLLVRMRFLPLRNLRYALRCVRGSAAGSGRRGEISPASSLYRVPWQSGQSMSTSGKNCTSSAICPVPPHVGQRSEPVLYENAPAVRPRAFAASVRANSRRRSSSTPL